jgi:hypothetical protein
MATNENTPVSILHAVAERLRIDAEALHNRDGV